MISVSNFYFDQDQIKINLDKVITKDYGLLNTVILYDLFSKHYRGQHIVFIDNDAENLYQTGFFNLLLNLQQIFSIPDQNITFQTVVPPLPQYRHIAPKTNNPNVFFKSAGEHLTGLCEFDLSQAKFVGALAASRFTVMRWLTLYELDRAFPNDTYLTFKNSADDVRQHIHHYDEHYQKELDWLATKNFDHHHMQFDPDSKAVNGLTACSYYGQVWHRYAIEVILETDDFANSWFTEKTARCLAVGRPFVLLAGYRSLRNLHAQGYHTFGDIIGEKYDKQPTPTLRLKSMIKSLQNLYTNPNRQQLIQQLFEIAKLNQNIYLQNVQS